MRDFLLAEKKKAREVFLFLFSYGMNSREEYEILERQLKDWFSNGLDSESVGMESMFSLRLR